MAKSTTQAALKDEDVKSDTLPAAQGAGTAVGVAKPFLDMSAYSGPIGDENIDREDVTVPRLKLGQSMSPEVKDGKAAEGDIFINVSGEVVWTRGDDPLPVHIVAQSKEYSLWRPRKDPAGDGILNRARPVVVNGVKRYRWDKPNESFDVKVAEGKIAVRWECKEFIDQDRLNEWGTEMPGNADSGTAATETHNYLVMLPTKGNIVAAVSLARTGVKVAKNLNALIKMGPRIPLALRRFTVSSTEERAGEDRYSNWNFNAAGVLMDAQGNLINGDRDEQLARQLMDAFKYYLDTSYVVDQSDLAAGSEGAAAGEMKDQIPF